MQGVELTRSCKLFEAYPKSRRELPAAYKAIYEKAYAENRKGETGATSLAQRMERWLHKAVSKDSSASKTTLELGAGTLNQLPYEPAAKIYDIVEPMAFLYEESPHRYRINEAFKALDDIPGSRRYDRITSCAVLEHVCDLPDLVARSALLLAPDGSFRASVPSEGGLLWTTAWKCTTGLEFRLRYRLDYGVLMSHEHVNTAAEIEDVVRFFFQRMAVRSLGVGRQFSFYRFIEASEPNLDRAQAWVRPKADVIMSV
jgi:hypothetical protein